MSIFLIRHGETDGNAARVVQMPDTPLSTRGTGQAERLARRLSHAGVSRILTSDYTRAIQTSEALQRSTNAPLEIHKSLRERHYGDLRGQPYTRVGEYILKEGYEPPNGESWPVFHKRVGRAWETVQEAARQTAGNLAVVTHGLVCFSLASRHLRLPDQTEAPTSFRNTALTIIDNERPWQVQLLGCAAHLNEGTPDDFDRPAGT